jgi:hypothetical protein
MKKESYLIYYRQLDGNFKTYNSDTKVIEVIERLPKTGHKYFVMAGYEKIVMINGKKRKICNEESLIKYANDFKVWVQQLRKTEMYGGNGIRDIDYRFSFTHFMAVTATFKKLCKDKYEHHHPIIRIEYDNFEGCYNAGLQYCGEPITCDSYGYDFSSQYLWILLANDFLIPSKQGTETHYDELPDILEYGIYRVKVITNNKDFKKVFSMSYKYTYTSISLLFALEVKDRFDLTFEMIQDGKPNAYVYDKECLVKSSVIFSNYKHLYKIKCKFPKNKLVKHLSSALWGHVNSFNTIRMTLDEMNEKNINRGMSSKCDYVIKNHIIYENNEYYELIDMKRPYNFNIRLKPFITSYARNQTARVALLDLDSVIRIHTDGVAFNKDMTAIIKESGIKRLLPENKTTGLIRWRNVSSYEKDGVIYEEYNPDEQDN